MYSLVKKNSSLKDYTFTKKMATGYSPNCIIFCVVTVVKMAAGTVFMDLKNNQL